MKKYKFFGYAFLLFLLIFGLRCMIHNEIPEASISQFDAELEIDINKQLAIAEEFAAKAGKKITEDRKQEIVKRWNTKFRQRAIDLMMQAKKECFRRSVSWEIEYARKFAEKGGTKLVKLDYSDEKIKAMENQGYISMARTQMREAEKCKRDASKYIDSARELTKKAGKSLEDIGYAKIKIERILQKGFKAEADYLVNQLN